MSKAVLLSVRPNWCRLITNGRKTVEVRKNAPLLETPFRCYIYETINGGGRGAVIGEFMCDDIKLYMPNEIVSGDLSSVSRIPREELLDYLGTRRWLLGWHISELKVYEKPIKLSDFCTLSRAPQSWCYVEEQ